MDRSSNCKMNIKQWHAENHAIQKKLQEMQSSISEVMRIILNFSTEITESYVLQFAKMQIELYNHISDNLEYHLDALNNRDDPDYNKAVLNYIEYMDMIVDNLSAFGVEEIASVTGERFDGSIHEVVSAHSDFSPHLSCVDESIRSGFRYEDIIIQKEQVRIRKVF